MATYIVSFRNKRGAFAMTAVEAASEKEAARTAKAAREAQGFYGWRVVSVRAEES